MTLKLIVVRTSELEKLAQFYSILGLSFEYHAHGNSPYHYSASIGETTFEIYPLSKGQVEPDKNLRLGFSVDNFDKVIDSLKSQSCKFFMESQETDFGFMAVVEDFDGRKVEVYKK